MDDLHDNGPHATLGPCKSFLALSLGTIAALGAVGLAPTRWLGGDGSLAAMAAGCTISLVAALLGTIPVFLARGKDPAGTVPAVMSAIALRLGVVILLGFVAIRSGWFEPAPLLIWLVLSHAFLQVAEIRLTRQVLYTSRS